MRCSLRAAIDGIVALSTPNAKMIHESEGFHYLLESDANGRLSFVTISTTIPPERAASTHATFGPQPTDPGIAPPLTVNGDLKTFELLTSRLQELESNLSFQTDALVRVRWHEVEESLIPETEDERNRVQAWSVSVATGSRRQPAILPEDSFRKLIDSAPRYRELVTLKSFCREAFNFLDNGQFVEAFNYYYYVIEDMFAAGKTSEAQVLKAFEGSTAFRSVCESCWPGFVRTATKHASALDAFFVQTKCPMTAGGLPRFLFRMRGNLHHYSRRSQRHANPFNQATFEPVALLAMHVARTAILFRIVELNQLVSSSGSSS